MLLDVSSFGLTGRQAESALLDAGVVTNRNSVPADPNGAWYTSGIRLGTPALTTRGFGHDEFDRVAELIIDVLAQTQPGTNKAGAPSKATYRLADGVADKIKGASAEMLDKHPLYPGLDLPQLAAGRVEQVEAEPRDRGARGRGRVELGVGGGRGARTAAWTAR